MSEIILNLTPDLTLDELKERFEGIAREYSLAVIEGTQEGNDYPDASDNCRFLSEFIFSISCAIEDQHIYKYETKHD